MGCDGRRLVAGLGITCATALWTVPLWSTTGTYSFPTGRHPIKYVHYVDRDKLFSDLFAKLGGQ